MNGKKKVKKICLVLVWIITILWFFCFITKGIDVTDMSLYLTQYKYFFEIESLRTFGTLFTTCLGACIYHCVPQGQVFALSLASWSLYIGSGVVIYVTFKKYLSPIICVGCIFLGSLFSLTWVHIMNYNATSMFILVLGICFLFKGFEEDSKKKHIFAGLMFGISAYFRFPNILYIMIGSSILWYYFILSKRWKKGWEQILAYVIGVLCGGIIGGIISIFILGFERIKQYIFSTANSAMSTESDHGIANIIKILFEDSKSAVIDWCHIGLPILAIIVITLIMCVIVKKEKIFIGMYYFLLGILALYGMVVGYKLEYSSQFPSMMAVWYLLIFLVGTFIYVKTKRWLSALSITMFITECLLCVGTDNSWNYHVVFMMLPLSICLMIIQHCQIKYVRELLGCIGAFVVAIVFVVGIRYATQYVYRDANNDKLQYTIKAEEYSLIKTSEERSNYLNQLEYVLEELDKEYMIAYGDCNIGYVISDCKPYVNSCWIDLNSYPLERFIYEMSESEKTKSNPVVLLADLEQNGVYRSQEKLEIIMNFMAEKGYYLYYENEWYQIFVPLS